MKRCNFKLNEKNEIIFVRYFPLNEQEPILEIRDDEEIYIGFSTVVGGVFNSNKPSYDSKNNIKNELKLIKGWFQSNDWKVNKRLLNEWQENDPRWKEYLKERKEKRKKQDELLNLLKH